MDRCNLQVSGLQVSGLQITRLRACLVFDCNEAKGQFTQNYGNK